jgi:hypothetical protein
MNHPMRRYALGLSNEPLFFSALMGLVARGLFDLHGVFADKRSFGLESSGNLAILLDGNI